MNNPNTCAASLRPNRFVRWTFLLTVALGSLFAFSATASMQSQRQENEHQKSPEVSRGAPSALSGNPLLGGDFYESALFSFGSKNFIGDCPPNLSGVVGCYRAEGNADDAISSNNGTFFGPLYAPGRNTGQAFSFYGGNRVSVSNSAANSYGSTVPMSVSLWIYRTGNGLQHILGKRDGCYFGGINYQFFYENNTLSFGSIPGYASTNDNPLPLDTWTHVAGTSDGTTLRLYVNGILKNSFTAPLGPENGAPLTVGTAGNCQSFVGKLDDLQLYNRALSLTEVQSVYNAANPNYAISGQITDGGTPVAGAKVVISGSKNAFATTDSLGNYSFGNLASNGNYLINPDKIGFAFNPPNRTFSNLSANQIANFTASSESYPPQPAGLTSFWRANSNAVDSVGDDHGALIGDANYASGKINQAFVFDGSTDAVNVPSSAGNSFAPNAPMSVALWAFRANADDRVHIIGKRDGCGGESYNYQMGIHNAIGAGLYFGSSGSLAGSGTDAVPLNQWVLLTGTFDGATFRIYQNGVLLGSQNGTMGPENTVPFKIGSSGTCADRSEGWRGRLDEVRIFNRALSQTEIRSIFDAEAAKFVVSGRIVRGTAAAANVAVALSGDSSGSTMTDNNGNYSFSVNEGGSYTVTPTLAGNNFTPASRTFNSIAQNQIANFSAVLVNYTISGRVLTDEGTVPDIGSSNRVLLSGTGISGTLSSSFSGTGDYSFPPVAAGGNYTVQYETNQVFSSTPQTVTNLQSNQTINLTATRRTYSISGEVRTPPNGNPFAGATITVRLAVNGSPVIGTATTGSDGRYVLTNIPAGRTYLVAPAPRPNYTFGPSELWTPVIQDVTNISFAALLQTYTISGNVKADGANLSGARVSLSGSQSQTVTTGADGNYSFTATAGGNYTVSVYKDSVTFNPASQSFTNLNANQTGNFQNGVYLCSPPSNGIVGWYKGENNANDSSGNSFNASLLNGATFDGGKVGQSFSFDGADDLVEIPHNSSLNLPVFTVGAWVYLDRTQNAGKFTVLIGKSSSSDTGGWFLSYDDRSSANNLRFSVSNANSGGVHSEAASSTAISQAGWYQITGTFDGAAARLYLNGSLIASGGSINGATFNTYPLRIGAANTLEVLGINDRFRGLIDETQIYNRALSAPEIAAIYNAGSAGVCTNSTFTPANAIGKIVFQSNRTGNSEIFTMNADGSGQTNITNNSASDSDGELSPDGSKIVFTSSRNSNSDIYVMNADGSNQIRLTTDAAFDNLPSWSPDGSRIVFASERDNNFGGEIYVMNVDGTNQIRLTNNSGFDLFPKFSPDGSRIVFYRSGEIFVMNSNGTNPVNLTNNSIRESAPTFSPDGSKIAFASGRNGNSEIYVMNAADGSNQIRLTTTNNDSNPSWQRGSGGVMVAPASNVSLTFAGVSQAGNTVATTLNPAQIPALPSGYNLLAAAPVYDFRTSAAFSGSIAVTQNVPNVESAAACSQLRLLHYEGTAWTTNGNSAPIYNSATQICTLTQTVTSLSPFAVGQPLAPTAAQIALSGRVLTAEGWGIRNTVVTVTDANGETRATRTNSFGYYNFDGLRAGEVYAVRVAAKNFIFPQPVLTVNAQENIGELNFVAAGSQ